ncbi:LamG domain-containing protein [bacterium]|nr:LamG domain-containing protein [bacterium]
MSTLAATSGGDSEISRNGLVAEYLSVSDATDTSGGGNDGTLSGAASVTGGALKLPFGSSFVTYPSGVLPNVGTVSLWVKADALGSDNYIFSHRTPGGARFYIATVDANDIDATVGDTSLKFTDNDAVVGTAYHLLITYGGGDAELFLDGASVGSFSYTDAFNATGGAYYNGAYLGASGFFLGSIDNQRIYNRKLVQSEIDALAAEAHDL